MINDDLAARVLQVIDSHPPRTPVRRAAAALYVALGETQTPAAARRILGTFGDPATQATAAELLDQLERGKASTA